MPISVLDRIVASVRSGLEATPPAADLEEHARAAAEARRRGGLRSLGKALEGSGAAVIAECKKKSPSAGLLHNDFDPVALARAYESGGAAAISVVTEPDFFAGDPRWLGEVRAAVSLPVLRKDFVVSRRQLFETAMFGADAVLLIQRLLTPAKLAELLETAKELQLEVLLEVFADEDPQPAVDSGAKILGVNARDLATFEVRLDRVEAMATEIPRDRVRVAESGISDRATVKRLAEVGYDAFLVGEHLVRSADPETAVRKLVGHGDGDGRGC
jgi:indole-3-glycerol phosphate synthase